MTLFKIRTRRLLASMLACSTVMPILALESGDDFRVFPFLQSPSDSGMIVNWFTESNTPGTMTISGGGLTSPLMINSTPEAIAVLQGYDDRERNNSTSNGYRLFADGNWKHQAVLTGLTPNTTYNYSVTQGGTTFSNTFKTAPTASDWDRVRFIAMSDSETEPRGNTNQRDWSVGAQATGSVGRPTSLPKDSSNRDLYPLTETVGYQQNMRIVNERNPDFVVMPGDMVQGGGYQSGWDEFWRHNAGEYDTSFSNKPLLPAYGNWENFAAVNGGYSITPADPAVAVSRHKYKAYFDVPSNGTPNHQDNYYRVDYGPVTIITLDSSNGVPDQVRRNPTALDTDTQSNYTADQYAAAVAGADPALGLTNDVSDFNPGSIQYQWAEDQIREARDSGQVVFVQWHNVAYSSGTHGFPMSHPNSSGQGGTPLRQYHPLFEELGVAAVLSGHSEMFERSFVDEDGDGLGVHYYDVGVSGDGMRGRAFDSVTGEIGGQNPFSQWTADGDEGELWELVDDGNGGSFIQLTDGGKHYGHLEVNIVKVDGDPQVMAQVTLTPVYSFPVLDENFQLIGDTERRVYGDEIVLEIGMDGSVVPEPGAAAILALAGLGVFTRRRRR